MHAQAALQLNLVRMQRQRNLGEALGGCIFGKHYRIGFQTLRSKLQRDVGSQS